jgi:septum formation protein
MTTSMRTPLILASQSPRRKKLLRQIGLKFRVMPSRADETLNRHQSPSENAERLAVIKARDIAGRLKRGIVIGADTIVVLDRHVLGKPRNAKDAVRMLHLLSGRTHIVYTGFALVDASTGQTLSAVEKTFVTFHTLDAKEIQSYVASGSPMDKAGAYGIQDDYGAVFVKSVRG